MNTNSRVRDYLSSKSPVYLIVNSRHWRQYERRAFTLTWCVSEEEAKCVAYSIEKCDRIFTTILKVEGGEINVL